MNETERPKEPGRWDEDTVTVTGEQNLEHGDGYETSGQTAQHPLLDGVINDCVWPGGAKPEAQQAVTKLRHRGRGKGAQEMEIGDALSQEVHSLSGRISSGAQETDSAVKPGRDDGQSGAQETEIGGAFSQGAQPIRENGQVGQWLKLKDILPKASSAWWNARIGHEGFTIKLRWRETDGQNPTLTFPRFMWEQFDINNRSDEEAKRIILEWIAGHLNELVLDPEKRTKALIAAEKLGIDLNNRPPD